jgi:hypothetical protein
MLESEPAEVRQLVAPLWRCGLFDHFHPSPDIVHGLGPFLFARSKDLIPPRLPLWLLWSGAASLHVASKLSSKDGVQVQSVGVDMQKRIICSSSVVRLGKKVKDPLVLSDRFALVLLPVVSMTSDRFLSDDTSISTAFIYFSLHIITIVAFLVAV